MRTQLFYPIRYMTPIRRIEREDCHLFYAEEDGGEIVGSAVVAKPVNGRANLDTLQVNSACRRGGWGRKLFEEAETRAKADGAIELTGDFSPDFDSVEASRRFFEKNGITVRGKRIFKKLR